MLPNGVYANSLGHRTVFVDMGGEGIYVLDVSAPQLCMHIHMQCCKLIHCSAKSFHATNTLPTTCYLKVVV
jgi:hypothetical protein